MPDRNYDELLNALDDALEGLGQDKLSASERELPEVIEPDLLTVDAIILWREMEAFLSPNEMDENLEVLFEAMRMAAERTQSVDGRPECREWAPMSLNSTSAVDRIMFDMNNIDRLADVFFAKALTDPESAKVLLGVLKLKAHWWEKIIAPLLGYVK